MLIWFSGSFGEANRISWSWISWSWISRSWISWSWIRELPTCSRFVSRVKFSLLPTAISVRVHKKPDEFAAKHILVRVVPTEYPMWLWITRVVYRNICVNTAFYICSLQLNGSFCSTAVVTHVGRAKYVTFFGAGTSGGRKSSSPTLKHPRRQHLGRSSIPRIEAVGSFHSSQPVCVTQMRYFINQTQACFKM